MQHLHALKNFLDHGIRNTDFLKLAVKAAAGFKEPFICYSFKSNAPFINLFTLNLNLFC